MRDSFEIFKGEEKTKLVEKKFFEWWRKLRQRFDIRNGILLQSNKVK